jgi:phosphate transport system permease protein
MTATLAPPPPSEVPTWVGERSTSPRRRFSNGIASAWMIGSVILALIPLGFIAFYVVAKGISVISWSFLTRNIPIISTSASGGIGPAIMGTLMLTFVAAVLSVPLGVLAAIYLNEYGGQRPTARVIRFMADVMTGVPSIVMGLFVAMIWVSAGLHRGYSTLAGSIALACLMLPIVIRTTDEMLRLVPNDLREGSFALGSRKVRTIRTVVLPHALPGIVSGSLLAVARAAGETAPLLFTIGITSTPNWNPFNGSNTTLSQQIFLNANTPFDNALERGYGAALALVLFVFLTTAVARIVTAIYSRRAAGA